MEQIFQQIVGVHALDVHTYAWIKSQQQGKHMLCKGKRFPQNAYSNQTHHQGL